MRLEARNGCSFVLRVERYEFPDEELGPTQDNPAGDFETGRFLVVSVNFTTADGSWESFGPYLTTSELDQFADWLESISRNAPKGHGIYFIERDIEWTLDENASTLTLHLCGSFLPPWKGGEDCISIQFPLSDIDLAGAANSLREYCRQFPGRPRQG